MLKTALERFWELVFAAIALNPEAFKLIQTLPHGSRAALNVVLIAGFSRAVGQGVVLFVNQVKPIRYVLSLLIAAMLFVFTVGFWVLSTWLVSHFVFRETISFDIIWRTLGLAYAPLIFDFLVALPYLGVPISVLLSVWTLLAFVVGLSIALSLDAWQAFWCGVLGWIVFQILQRTIGRPVMMIGQWVANMTAGKRLVTDMPGLEQLLQNKLKLPPDIDQTVDDVNKPTDRR